MTNLIATTNGKQATVICSKAGRAVNPTVVYLNPNLEANTQINAEFSPKKDLHIVTVNKPSYRHNTQITVERVTSVSDSGYTTEVVLEAVFSYSLETKFINAIKAGMNSLESNLATFYKPNLFHSTHKNAPTLIENGEVIS